LLLLLFRHAAVVHSSKLFRCNVSDGGNETAEFVNGEQRFANLTVERVLLSVPLCVREYRPDDFLVYAALAEDFRAFTRVVGRIRPTLVVEVVNQSGYGPGLDVFAEMGGV